MQPKDISILFLAYYAPQGLNSPIPTDIKDVVYAEYHHKIFRVLNSLFPKLRPCSDPSIMLQLDLKPDFIFSLYNRMPFRNSEVFISAVAEYYHIPYLGARPNIRALAEDKHLAKMMAKYACVPTPEWTTYNVGKDILPPEFRPPYFVKPRFGAASAGIDESSICITWVEALGKITQLHQLGLDAILEKQIIGVYHTCPVINNFDTYIFFPCIVQHSTLKNGVVTYEQKRKITPGLTREILTDSVLQAQMTDYSRRMFSLVQPLDYTRFDYIVEECSGIVYFLEFNVCCNLGEHSTVSQAAAHLGISYESLIANITYSSMFRSGLIEDSFGKKL